MIGALRTVRRIRRERRRFAEWLADNPGATFADYYVAKNVEQIERGEVQPVLGREIQPEFAAGADGVLRRLCHFGLRAPHRLVDYGCGSLRLARVAVPYLAPGGYWGLDVSDDFFRMGLESLPEEVTQRGLRVDVISDEALGRVAAWEPDMVICVGVLFHVHPQELPGFMANIARITGPNTQTVIKVRIWRGPTLRTGWCASRGATRSCCRCVPCGSTA